MNNHSQTFYKAVRAADHTSHRDAKTLWREGETVTVIDPDTSSRSCGRGLHCSPSLLTAVGYQTGPSEYCLVSPASDLLGADSTKSRFASLKCERFLSAEETDALAGLCLWEVNHPHNPFLMDAATLSVADALPLLAQWASVGASVGASVWASVGASVWASVWAYIGSLFPAITQWQGLETFGPTPFAPLRALWLSGYVPSFDGTTWRLYAGKKASVAWSGTANDLPMQVAA